MRKEKIKSFVLGVISAMVILSLVTVFAATIDVEIGGIRVFWDGEEKTMTDVNGNKVEPMIYNGTTYVPLRAMSELLGKSVEWDGDTTTVYVGGRPAAEPVTVATVNKAEITDQDINYHIYENALKYANGIGMSREEYSSFDWSTINEEIVNAAVNDAINEELVIQKGAENGIELNGSDIADMKNTISGILASYGREGFILRTRTMGIASPEQYERMYRNVIAYQKVVNDISINTDKYLPNNINILNNYIQPDGATVKHILITADETNKDEKRKIAESVLKRIQNGEDFDKLAEEFNEDPGATPQGYTFGTGEMVEPFEKASFELKIGETSGIVETDYGFHIIRRLPGIYELQAYWQVIHASGISINKDMLNTFDVNAVLKDVADATNELNGQ